MHVQEAFRAVVAHDLDGTDEVTHELDVMWEVLRREIVSVDAAVLSVIEQALVLLGALQPDVPTPTLLLLKAVIPEPRPLTDDAVSAIQLLLRTLADQDVVDALDDDAEYICVPAFVVTWAQSVGVRLRQAEAWPSSLDDHVIALRLLASAQLLLRVGRECDDALLVRATLTQAHYWGHQYHGLVADEPLRWFARSIARAERWLNA